MSRPSPIYLQDSTAAALTATARELAQRPGDVVCVMVAEEGAPDLHNLAGELRRSGVQAFGGIFPGVIYEGHVYGAGAVLHAFPALAPPGLVGDLRRAFRPPRGLSRHEPGTALVFLSGRAAMASRFLYNLFDGLGASYRYIGAGATGGHAGGPCVFADGAVAADGAVVALLDVDAAFEAAHGHRKVGTPLVVTRADHNVVHELNWEPAARVLAAELGHVWGGSNGAASNGAASNGMASNGAKPHSIVGVPLGLHKEGREPLVREVVDETAEGGLVCIGEVPENAVLSLLSPGPLPAAKGRPQALDRALGAPPSWYWTAASATRLRARGAMEDLEARARQYRTAAGEWPFGVLSQGEVAYGGCGCLELTGRTFTIGALACRPDASRAAIQAERSASRA